MNRWIIGLIICLALIGCSRTEKDKLDDTDFTNLEQMKINSILNEQKEIDNIQAYAIYEKNISKMEITKENIFSEFPQTPNHFVENNFPVIIRKIDEREPLYPEAPDFFIENSSAIIINIIEYREPLGPLYFGREPVYVIGKNFEIIYETIFHAAHKEYKIRSVTLKGKSMFSFWNQFFDATWDDVKKSWGEPVSGGRSYYDNTDWYFVSFRSIDNISGKIKEINISREL